MELTLIIAACVNVCFRLESLTLLGTHQCSGYCWTELDSVKVSFSPLCPLSKLRREGTWAHSQDSWPKLDKGIFHMLHFLMAGTTGGCFVYKGAVVWDWLDISSLGSLSWVIAFALLPTPPAPFPLLTKAPFSQSMSFLSFALNILFPFLLEPGLSLGMLQRCLWYVLVSLENVIFLFMLSLKWARWRTHHLDKSLMNLSVQLTSRGKKRTSKGCWNIRRRMNKNLSRILF